MFHQDYCKQDDSKMVKTLNIYTCNWYSGHFLEANYKLIKQLNPDLKFRWLICNHNPPGYNDIVNHEEYVIFDKKNYDNNIGSISHGKGMNYLFRQAINLKLDAYYHLTLDPDFYLFRPVKNLINKIIDLNIDILGAAYVFQPSRNFKLLYYPTVFCELFNGSSVDILKLDFTSLITTKGWRQKYGFIPEVSHKIWIKMRDGYYKYHTINGISDTNSVDIYRDDEHLFGIHIHARRCQGFPNKNKAIAKNADEALKLLPFYYDKHKGKQ